MVSLNAHSGNQSDALRVNWDRGAGDLSGYLLTLCNPNGSQQARTQLGSEATEFIFSDLVPGRLYRAEVLSLSGELSNGASTLGRTGERTAATTFIVIIDGENETRDRRCHQQPQQRCISTASLLIFKTDIKL